MNTPRVSPPILVSGESRKEAAATVLIGASALVVTGCFFWIIADMAASGLQRLSISFLTQAPRNSGRDGGILPIIASTLWILAIALAAAVPVGVAVAAWLAEFIRNGDRLAVVVRCSVDVLAAAPSIVFGLFGNALFCVGLGLGYSLLSGGLTLACMVLPILIRSLLAGFQSVPHDYRLAAAALGMSKTRTLASILLPAAAPGLAVGIVLGVGRVLAETAALLFTSGYVDRMPRGPLDSGRSLSIHIYDLAMNIPGGEANSYATAIVLVALLLLINGAATTIADRWLHRSLTWG